MKKVFQAAAYSCGGIMGVAVGCWGAGWCSWLTCAMILLGCGCGLFVTLHELAVMRRYEQRQQEAARRSAYRAAFFREVDKPV